MRHCGCRDAGALPAQTPNLKTFYYYEKAIIYVYVVIHIN